MRMTNVTAKVASGFLIGVAAAAVSMSLPAVTASAADSCQTEPGSDNPQGKHWHYRIERGTGRHCWYLRAEDKSASADEDKGTSSARSAPRKIEGTTSRSIADAHAEIAAKAAPTDNGANTNAATAPSVWPAPPVQNAAASAAASRGAPADTPQDSSLATRWPQGTQTQDAQTAQAAPADGSQPEASLMVADAQSDSATDSQDAPPPVAPPATQERNTGTIQKLAMVAAGALALAGLTGSAVYRLGRRRRRNEWLHERSERQYAQNAPRPPWVNDEPQLYHSDPDVSDLDDLHHPEAEPDFALETGFETHEHDAHERHTHEHDADEPAESVEDFLARLTRQLHEELGPRPHRA
jgi:hypothetical protein